MYENRMLRKIFGPKRDDVTGEWRRLQNGQLHDLLLTRYSRDYIEKREIAGTRDF